MRRIVFSLVAATLAAPPLAAQDKEPANPVQQFLKAADANDVDAMRGLLADDLRWVGNKKITPDKFLQRISNCYLRRVYRDELEKRLIAAWMCDEGKGKSRVVLGQLAYNKDGKVLVGVIFEQRNKVPAPPRTGSAFGEEKAEKSE